MTPVRLIILKTFRLNQLVPKSETFLKKRSYPIQMNQPTNRIQSFWSWPIKLTNYFGLSIFTSKMLLYFWLPILRPKNNSRVWFWSGEKWLNVIGWFICIGYGRFFSRQVAPPSRRDVEAKPTNILYTIVSTGYSLIGPRPANRPCWLAYFLMACLFTPGCVTAPRGKGFGICWLQNPRFPARIASGERWRLRNLGPPSPALYINKNVLYFARFGWALYI